MFFCNAKERQSMDTAAIESKRLHNDRDNMTNTSQQPINDTAQKGNQKPKKPCSQSERAKTEKQNMLYSQEEREKDLNNRVASGDTHPSKYTAPIIIDDDIPQVDTQAASKSKTFIGRNQNSYQKEYVDLECPMQTPPRWPPLALSDCRSDLGSVVEDSVAHNRSYLSGTETMVQDHNGLMDRSSFDSDSASNSNDILLEGACTLVCSQEKLQADVHSTEAEASLSVSSHYRKRKKMADFQLNSCTRPYSFDYPREESCCIFSDDNVNTTQKDPHVGIRISAESGCLKLEHKESFSPSYDPRNVKKLHLCCSSCKCSLGLRENHFLIPCSLVLSSKFCSSVVLKNGPSIQSPQSLLGNDQMKIPVAITDIANVDQHVLNSHMLEGSPQPDIWSKQDGCVFRSICCPFCGVSDNCLGLQIMATDASNTYLLNKIFLFVDCLYIKDDVGPKKEEPSPASVLILGNGLDLTQIEQCAHMEQPMSSKSKLRLPKRGPAI